MATTFVIACPDCGKQVKVSDEHVGKRVKCKECGAVYPVKAPGGAKKEPPPAPAKAKPPAAKKAAQSEPPVPAPEEAHAGYRYEDDEDAGPKQYSLEKTDDNLPRCPFCAQQMPSMEALICLNCGYNTRTRTRPEVKQVYGATFGEYFLWFLPAIFCVLIIIGLLVWYIIFWMNIEEWMRDSVFEDEPGPPPTYLGGLGPPFVRVYLALITLAIYVPLVRFSYKRFFVNNKPPERKIKEDSY
jgi:DNA-directed RNA polymerase subunit RPC12/RpoP